MHFHGYGVKKDVAEAIRWYRRAAAKNGSEGMNNLGHVYRRGLGVDRDLAEAARWFQKAAALQNPWALQSIAERLLEAAQRGMWAEPEADTLAQLRAIYLQIDSELEGREA